MGKLSGRLLIALIAATVAIAPARAQRVRGILVDSATGEPVPGAVVTVLDSAGRLLSRTIADQEGRFAAQRLLGARQLHVVRIGYRPANAAIAPSDTIAYLRLVPIASQLATLTASSRRVCPGQATGGEALELWEQVRSGLLANVVSRESNPARLRVRSYWITRDPVRKAIESDSSDVKDIVADRSYVAARPAWAFEADGYMREHLGGAREYFAPDEAVLIDPSFAATHCMRIAAEDASHRGQIGIAFEPAEIPSRDTLVEVQGTLWLDRQRLELRSFEFVYTNLEPRANGSGGVLTFETMPNGVPMIVRWSIHSPILAIDVDPNASGVRRRPPPRSMRANVRVLGYQESGGVTGLAIWPDGTHWDLGVGRILGVVVDSAGRPVPGARVWINGGRDTVATNPVGVFEFPYQFPGQYVLITSDSVLAREGVGRNIPTRLWVSEKTHDAPVQLRMHPRSEVLPLICPPKSYKPGSGVVLARVMNSDGTPAERARIEVEMLQRIVARDSIERTVRRIGETGDDGRFVVCGTALNQPIVIRGFKDTRSGEGIIERWTDEVAILNIVLRSRTAPQELAGRRPDD